VRYVIAITFVLAYSAGAMSSSYEELLRENRGLRKENQGLRAQLKEAQVKIAILGAELRRGRRPG